MRILVLGGTAFMGPHAISRLASEGHQLSVVSRGVTPFEAPAGVECLHFPEAKLGDRRFLEAHREELRKRNPELVLDMLPLTETCVAITQELLRGRCQRYVAISSQDVYRAYDILCGRAEREPDQVPLSEDAPLRDRLFPYRGEEARPADHPAAWMDDYDKILVERQVLSDPDIAGTVLRIPMVHGPGDRQHRPYEWIRRMQDERPAIVLEDRHASWRWTPGYVEDMGHAIALAVTNPAAANQTYNVGEAEALSVRAWIEALADDFGWKGDIVEFPRERLPESLRQGTVFSQDLVTDTARIRDELAYSETIPRDLAISRTAQWERDNPPGDASRRSFDYAAEDRLLEESL